MFLSPRIRRALLIALAIFSTLLATACGSSQNKGSGVLYQVKQSIDESYNKAQYEDVLEQSERMLTLNPGSIDRVWALGRLLQSARELERKSVLQSKLDEMEEALASLSSDEGAFSENNGNKPVLAAYQQADAGLRAVQSYMFGLWKEGDTSEPVTQAFLRSGELYQGYFDGAIAYSEVLWYEGEFIYLSGRPLEAVVLFDEMLVKDLQGHHDKLARERIASAWAEASQASKPASAAPTPREIPPRRQVWLDQLNAKANDTAAPELRRRELKMRIATMYLGFDHVEEGHKILLGLTDKQDELSEEAVMRYFAHSYGHVGLEAFHKAFDAFSPEKAAWLWTLPNFRQQLYQSAESMLAQSPPNTADGYTLLVALTSTSNDDVAVKAASRYLEFAAVNENRKEFRIIRKALQANKYLWKEVKFRALVFKLKEQVEGKP